MVISSPAIDAQLNSPEGLAIDALGNIVIADTGNYKIRRVDGETGIITTVAGNGITGFAGDGSQAINAQLSNPKALVVDESNNLFFSDTGNYRIRRVDGVTGIITTIAGNGIAGFAGDSGPAMNAQINYSNGVALDAMGNLMISDGRIRRIDRQSGIITTIAGLIDPVGMGPVAVAKLADTQQLITIENKLLIAKKRPELYSN